MVCLFTTGSFFFSIEGIVGPINKDQCVAEMKRRCVGGLSIFMGWFVASPPYIRAQRRFSSNVLIHMRTELQ